MNKIVKFKDMLIGSYGLFGVVPFIKISNSYDYSKGMSKNTPNAFILSKFHYAVINPKTYVYLVKSPKDY